MKIHQYDNYEQYTQAQTETNKRKLKNVWVQESTIKEIHNRVGHFENIHNILCHGTRNGAEQKLFKKYFPNAKILGTEISETATQFPNTIQWDFQKQRDDWIGKWDLIYTNSFDHTTQPQQTLLTWKNQLHKYGVLFLEHCFHPEANKARYGDPLELSENELTKLINDDESELYLVDVFDTLGMAKLKSRTFEIITIEGYFDVYFNREPNWFWSDASLHPHT